MAADPTALPNVVVNLRVNVDAQGTINVFSETEPDDIVNEVVCTAKLPVSDLYTPPSDASNPYSDSGLFRFQEAADADDYVAEVVPAYAGAATLSADLHDCLQGGLTVDAAAEPFTTYTDAAYRSYPTIGDMALAVAAHHLFGHVQATAAIDNDTTFVAYMNNNTATGAAIAATLAERIKDSVTHMNADNAYAVVKQVLGQDASRATLQDNTQAASGTATDKWQNLQWRAGDIIYVQVTLKTPTVNYGTNSASQQYQPPVLGANQEYEIVYDFKIELE